MLQHSLSNPVPPKKKARSDARSESRSDRLGSDLSSTEGGNDRVEQGDDNKLLQLQKVFKIWKISCSNLQEAIQSNYLQFMQPAHRGLSTSCCQARFDLSPLNQLFTIQTFETTADMTVTENEQVLGRRSLLTFFQADNLDIQKAMARSLLINAFGARIPSQQIGTQVFFGDLRTCAFLAWLTASRIENQVCLKVVKKDDLEGSLEYLGSEWSSICVIGQR